MIVTVSILGILGYPGTLLRARVYLSDEVTEVAEFAMQETTVGDLPLIPSIYSGSFSGLMVPNGPLPTFYAVVKEVTAQTTAAYDASTTIRATGTPDVTPTSPEQPLGATPAQIVMTWLTGTSPPLFAAVQSDGSYDSGGWPLYVSSIPDGDGVPDDAACVYDTAGRVHTRLLASGKSLQSFGLQLKVRSPDYATAFALCNSAIDSLETVKRDTVIVDGTSYGIDTVTRSSPVFSMGQDQLRRALIVVNALVMLTC